MQIVNIHTLSSGNTELAQSLYSLVIFQTEDDKANWHLAMRKLKGNCRLNTANGPAAASIWV